MNESLERSVLPGKAMSNSLGNCVGLWLLSSLVGLIALTGDLLWLELKERRGQRRAQREHRGPPGQAILVRGLGFRSEPSIKSLRLVSKMRTGSPLGARARQYAAHPIRTAISDSSSRHASSLPFYFSRH
jgi:hypothetical protein